MLRNSKLIQSFKNNNGVLSSKDLQILGLNHYSIKNLIEEGKIERIKRGYYIHTEVEEDDISIVKNIIPTGVFCLLSAASVFDLSTNVPNKYYLAVKGNLSPHIPDYPPIKIHYWKNERYHLGIIKEKLNGVNIKIYDKEKTVCDFIKFRHRMERSVVKEVLTSYLSSKERDLVKLKEYSVKLKVEKTLNNYLEILL